ncbi:hypothetical protein R3P38DRAFT_2543145 [Favolaschia claudopus]|uniref:Exostosin GT47 domain-containing protein n=1 Tax=Favolaschia claudopus TaxID=2862362 RepID=A0AAW0AT08_9AGAR
MWNIRFSDPYQAITYDLLHFDESGRWAHHQKLSPALVSWLTTFSNATNAADDETSDSTKAESLEGFGRRIPKSTLEPGSPSNHWIFGSRLRHGDNRSYEDLHGGNNPMYRAFDPRLRDFLHAQFPNEYLTYEDTTTVYFSHFSLIEVFQFLYLSYQSKEDWRNAEDILRCNSNWNKEGSRYDCILFNSDEPGLACARLRSLIRCKLPSSRIVDLAIVNPMKISKWRPKTVWDGCLVHEESKDLSFLLRDSCFDSQQWRNPQFLA